MLSHDNLVCYEFNLVTINFMKHPLAEVNFELKSGVTILCQLVREICLTTVMVLLECDDWWWEAST
jgi:hypothetical protein